MNGHAIGIGLTMALQADIRIFAEDAKCGVVQVRRGVIPDCMSHWTIPHLAGLTVAADMLLTGPHVPRRRGAALGIATSALPADAVLRSAMASPRTSPRTWRRCRRRCPSGCCGTPSSTATRRGRSPRWRPQLHHRVMGSADAREGVAAFVERRPPRWSSSVSAEWIELPDPSAT